ncbi:MAG TPA: PD-(D/E)XK nuclease family protein [Vicinamibacteria bacterium]|nr:PD-(D/E)XK nuclease family protein [Vicinamibacteria bacterium]
MPSRAAALEWPRRLAETGRALAFVYAMKPRELARAIAEPELLGRGLQAWDPGHDALLAARLLDAPHGLTLPEGAPRAPVAAALARTLHELRLAGLAPDALEALAAQEAPTPEDAARRRALAFLYRAFHAEHEGRADPATLLAAAAESAPDSPFLRGATLLVVDDVETDALDRRFLEAVARSHRLVRLERLRPPGVRDGSFAAWAEGVGIAAVDWSETLLGSVAPEEPPAGLRRLRTSLFEPAVGEPVEDGSVELLTAPGEAAEARSIARRLLREARRGVPFEQMGIVLARPAEYAPLFSDLLERLGVPYRLHPSLPLRYGRAARSLLLLLRCRGLERSAVLEFLSFAPLPLERLLRPGAALRAGHWDQLSRDARVVSGLDRWRAGLRVLLRDEAAAARGERDPARRARRERRLADAQDLERLVEALAETLGALSGEASWSEWSQRLRAALDRFVGEERDREAVLEVLHDLAGLGGARATPAELESVLLARFEWERVPLPPVSGGAVHVGAMDAMAGLTFRVLAFPGLGEGGFPGAPRPDPFLLDAEREALAPPAPARPTQAGQLGLFDAAPPAAAALATTQDRLREARRAFHRAVSQATEKLVLSYPRADPRSGRERMPSLFFVAAASTLAAQPLGLSELHARVSEDDEDLLPAEEALDAGERDRARVRKGGREAALAVAQGSRFFRQSRLASLARWSRHLTPYDGLVAFSPRDGEGALDAARLLERLDPSRPGLVLSATRLATWARCGFQYLLEHVLRLEAREVPEERKRLEPLERGNLFHRVAEEFLRERREQGQLPVTNDAASQDRLLEMCEAALQALVEGSPPRFTSLWEREKARFRATALAWLERLAAEADKRTPAWFEVGFGLPAPEGNREPWREEPVAIDLGDGRAIRISGRIDRIDRRPEGGLVLRDYKTGRAPFRDDGGFLKGGRQLQIPFYVLAARELFPEERVVEAFLDYVDGGRRVVFDPAAVEGEGFRTLLRGLADAIASGLFVQEPQSCDLCDFTEVCGPKPLLQQRRTLKLGDPFVKRVLRLRDMG